MPIEYCLIIDSVSTRAKSEVLPRKGDCVDLVDKGHDFVVTKVSHRLDLRNEQSEEIYDSRTPPATLSGWRKS